MEAINGKMTGQCEIGGEMQPVHINVAKDFNRYPGGRYRDDGPGNGTAFREDYLLPVLKNNKRAIVFLDGAAGYPASFLEEAFGGLVRKHGYDADTILKTFEFSTSQVEFDFLDSLIEEYVIEASGSGN